MNFESALAAKLHRAGCPDTETLGAYHLSQLEQSETANIAQHLEICPHCQAELAALQQFMALPHPQLAQDAAADVSSKTGYPTIKRWTAKLIQIGSQLVDDLGQIGQTGQTLAPALRGSGTEMPPHVYTADDIQIIIEAQPIPQKSNTMRLSGTIFSLDHRFYQVVLENSEHNIPSSPIDEMGYFLFDNLTLGQYSLTIIGETAEIEIPHFKLEG